MSNSVKDISFEELADRSNLTRSQLMIYLGQERSPDAPLYNMTLGFTLAAIDPDRLDRAFRLSIERNDTLRMVFHKDAQGVLSREFLTTSSWPVSDGIFGAIQIQLQRQDTGWKSVVREFCPSTNVASTLPSFARVTKLTFGS